MSMIQVSELECNRCEHKWLPRTTKTPKYCPNCNSPYWNKKRVRLSWLLKTPPKIGVVVITGKQILKTQEAEIKKNPPVITRDEVVGYSKERQIKGNQK